MDPDEVIIFFIYKDPDEELYKLTYSLLIPHDSTSSLQDRSGVLHTSYVFTVLYVVWFDGTDKGNVCR